MNTQQKLTQLNDAISAIESGAQEYQIGSRRVKKADISVLYRERQRLEQQLDNERTNGGVYVVCFDRR